MKSFSQVRQVVATVALAALSFGAQSVPIYSLANGGETLVRFDSSTPGTVIVVGAITGAAGGGSLSGLDFRPATGLLYGYQQRSPGNQQNSSSIYFVDTNTGATTLSSTFSAGTTGQTGIDFNPVVDRLRVVSTGDNNLRINVDTGAATVDTMFAYGIGDPNFGINPNIVDAAYTFSDRNPATGTSLYYIDSGLGTLVTTSNPNGGVLTTVGSLLGSNINIDPNNVGFDIFTDSNGVNTAFASLQVGSTTSLYTVNLATGAATPIGPIMGFGRQLFGLAVALPVAVNAIPEPGTLALFGAAVLAFGITRRRAAGSVVKTPASRT